MDDLLAAERRTPLDGLDDTALVRRVAGFDAEAFDRLYDRHSGGAYSLAVRMVGRGGRAEDVVQEAFLALWRGAGRFDPQRSEVRTWLLALVHHRAVDALRKLTVVERHRADEEALDTVAPRGLGVADEVGRRDEARIVRAALEELPPDQRQALELAYYGGWTQVEIAERLGVPLGTVKGRMRLGLDKLRRALEERAGLPA